MLEAWLESNPDAIVASARDGDGIEGLADAVLQHLRGEVLEVRITIPLRESRLVDLVEKRTEVLDRDYDDATKVVLRTRIGRRQVEILLATGASFEIDGIPGNEALAALWPEPVIPAPPRIPPHLSLHPR